MCEQCRYEHLLAFSCRGRDFCPSCHQKRVLRFGAWAPEQALAPVAPGRAPKRQWARLIEQVYEADPLAWDLPQYVSPVGRHRCLRNSGDPVPDY